MSLTSLLPLVDFSIAIALITFNRHTVIIVFHPLSAGIPSHIHSEPDNSADITRVLQELRQQEQIDRHNIMREMEEKEVRL